MAGLPPAAGGAAPVMRKIAVIGAGPAGLACARQLLSAGVDVTVFDKSRGVGGRCATRRSEVGCFHHGAPSFTARSAAFHAEVRRWQQAGCVRPVPASERWAGWPAMNALARHWAAGLRVVTGATLAALEPEDEGGGNARAPWRLRFGEPGMAPAGGFDAVAVAVPAEQARALVRGSAVLSAALQDVHSQPCWTLMLAWPAAAAPLVVPALGQGGVLGAVVDCSELPQGLEGSAPAGGARWTLHACADWSRSHLESSPQAVTEALWQALAQAMPATHPLPAPTHAVAHRWRYAQVAQPAASAFGWDAALRLGCCGDAWSGQAATDGPPADGVERAWLSGVGLAQVMAPSGSPAAGS